MVLTNGMECQNFKWILTQLVLTVIVIVIVIVIDIQATAIKATVNGEWDRKSEEEKERTWLKMLATHKAIDPRKMNREIVAWASAKKDRIGTMVRYIKWLSDKWCALYHFHRKVAIVIFGDKF